MPNRDGNGGYSSHGTRCAGEIIMQPNNNICGIGTAYGASLGGIKFLDDGSTDTREAKVLKHALKYVCIYSNSWGPADTGTFMEHLTDFVKRSLSKGIHQGRDGKGAIYVFAAGNGKTEGDNCACDGYVNSIYTIVIASCDDSGHVAHYSERCASIMATAYSGSGQEKNVLTTDVKGKCTASHTGTSAAAPLVSGIIALALSANPNLTWRDVQHLLAWTSQVAPLSDNYGWNRNKAGFFYSVDFGFGLVNAYKLIQEAMKWENVPEMLSCGIRIPKVKGFSVTRNRAARITVYSNGCEGLSGEIKYIEYVQLVLTMSYTKRGDIQIAMKSPLGTECHVLENRPKDFNTQGLQRWTFSILAFWGESPKGNFVIDIYDTTGEPYNKGIITEMTLSLHGTKDQPKIYQNGPRPYDAFKLAKPKDKPRFANLSRSGVKSLEKPKIQKRPNVTNRQEYQIDNEATNQVLNDEMLQQNILLAMEQEAANQEDTIIQDYITSNMMNTANGL
uniref:Neuroendocrine convertase 1 n=2 Tax=Melanaphis sacchari TaxID=742174 RepID=A0A2H8TZJ6_9HEMI